jgi:uncharacterized protein
MSEFRIDVADLLTHPAAHRPVRVHAALAGLGGSAARIDDPVDLDLMLERVPDGVVARGTVRARWTAECGSCLQPIGADVEVRVAELFEHQPVEGETYPLDGHEIDLELLVRDGVLLELPLAPTCASVGLDPCGPQVVLRDVDPEPPESLEPPTDPRWAALSELDL